MEGEEESIRLDLKTDPKIIEELAIGTGYDQIDIRIDAHHCILGELKETDAFK